MIAITGAAGFIGSVVAGFFESTYSGQLVLVDDFSKSEKSANFVKRHYHSLIQRDQFPAWLSENHALIESVIHLGARTDTTEFDVEIFNKLNLNYSKKIWELCTRHQIPLIYASSAATYGAGEHGYDDDHRWIEKLHPLNPYGDSKQEFDKWVLKQSASPPVWYGLKFFNVYGPNEYHKGRMASVIFHAYNQIKNNGVVKLFRSHRPDYSDGGQLRDFVYVKDVAEVIGFLSQKTAPSGIYNLGTGQARTFYDLACATFAALNLNPEIDFIDTPIDIRDKYQYFTEANMQKLKHAGYNKPFSSLESGVEDYVKNYLVKGIVF